MKQSSSSKPREIPDADKRNIEAIIERLERLAYSDLREGRQQFMENYTRLLFQHYDVSAYWTRYKLYLKATNQEIGK